jgi:tetratricopeptide (TPR) repeat protein
MDAADYDAAAGYFEREAALWATMSRAPGDSAANREATALANASCARRLGDDPRAAEALARRAIDRRPGSRDAWAHLGDHLYKLARFDDAVAAYSHAAAIDPQHAWPHYGTAGALRAAGDAPGALAAIDRAIAIGYADEAKTRDLYLRRAHICQATGDWDGAEAAYRTRAELATGHPAYALPALNVAVARDIAQRGPGKLAAPPYRRYGLALDLWVHSEFPMAYRVQLAAIPDLAMRVAIARIVRRALPLERFALDEPWSWSDRFVVIRLCPSEDARPHPHATFVSIARAFDAIHAAYPIVEVVALGARSIDREDRGERWSIATRPVPDPGPFFDEPVALWPDAIADTRRFPAPVVDPAVEDARAAPDDEPAFHGASTVVGQQPR